MSVFTVQNEKGDQFQVKQENLGKAASDGYLPVVKKGDSNDTLRVKPENLSKAQADGYMPVGQQSDAAIDNKSPSVSDSIMQGIQKSGTLGLKDRISGLIDAALGSKFGDMLVPSGGQNPYKDMSSGELYQQGKNDSAQQYAAAEQAHPIATTVGSVIGGIPGAVIAGPSIKGSMALGAAYGAGSSQDSLSDLAKSTAEGAGIGAITGVGSRVLGKVVGSGMEALEEATPAMSSAQNLAKVATGLSGEPIQSQSAGDFFSNLGKGSAVGHVGSMLGIPGGAAVGVPYALSRTPMAQQAASTALEASTPALKATDKLINTGAEMINSVFDKLSPQLKQNVSQAAQQGGNQLAITHFLLGNTKPEYQAAMSQK